VPIPRCTGCRHPHPGRGSQDMTGVCTRRCPGSTGMPATTAGEARRRLMRQVEASHRRLRDPRHPVRSSTRDPSRTTRHFRLQDPPWRIDRAGRWGPGGHGAARGARGDWRDSDGPAPGSRAREERGLRRTPPEPSFPCSDRKAGPKTSGLRGSSQRWARAVTS